MRCTSLVWLSMLGLSSSIASAQSPNTEPFLVGIGRSIHDSMAVSAAMSWLGVRSMRLDVPWKQVETSTGRYAMPAWIDRSVDDALARGVEPLLILVYGHPAYGNDKPRTPQAIAAYVRYAAFVVRHFKGRVRLYDLWNEWETHTGYTTPGTPEEYVALAKHAYPAIKTANPDALVLSGGMLGAGIDTGWLERFFSLGGLKFVDALSVHPYNYQKAASDAPERAIDMLDRIHARARAYAGSRDLPIYVTEVGYPNHAGKAGIAPDIAALYLARFYLLASTRDYIAGVWWYCLRDQGGDRANKEHNFGVLDFGSTPKPAARTLGHLAQLLGDVRRFRDESSGTQRRLTGTRSNGASVVLTWNERSTDTALLANLATLAARPQAPVALTADPK